MSKYSGTETAVLAALSHSALYIKKLNKEAKGLGIKLLQPMLMESKIPEREITWK